MLTHKKFLIGKSSHPIPWQGGGSSYYERPFYLNI